MTNPQLKEVSSRVALVADSSVSLPSYFFQEFVIRIVPVVIVVSNRSYKDGIDLHPMEFGHFLERYDGSITTSAPSPDDFLRAFKDLETLTSSIICLTMMRRLSGTYDSACIAARLAKMSNPSLRIEVIDSETAAGAEALLVITAGRAANMGFDLDSIVARMEGLKRNVGFIGMLDNLGYLSKSGKVPGIASWLTSLLKLKLLLEIKDGHVRLFARPRSRAKAFELIVKHICGRVGNGGLQINVMQSLMPEQATELATKIRFAFRQREPDVIVTEFSPAIIAHSGPHLVGVAWIEE